MRAVAIAVAFAVLGQAAGASQWPVDPSANLPIGTDPNANRSPIAVSDGDGGAIIAWEYSGPPTAGRDIYLQRVSALGVLQWGPIGIPATSAPDLQMRVSIAEDGAGGAVVAWQDYRSGLDADIYVQRVSAEGNVMWSPNGVPACAAANDQIEAEIVSDDLGGVVVVWRDMRGDGVTADVYAQRISPNGGILWNVDGVPICTDPTDQERLDAASTSGGSTVVVWDDSRNQAGSSQDIFAQRLTPTGTVAWALNGPVVCSAPRWQVGAQCAAVENGKVIITWEDDRTVANGRDIYVQQIDTLGVAGWIADGVPVCTTPHTQLRPQIVSYGNGAVVCWPDSRNGSSIYASRLDSNGQAVWAVNGAVVCEAPGVSDWPKITGDDAGRIFVAWEDTRNNPSYYDIYAQRLDATGSAVWTQHGIAMSTAVDSQRRVSPVSDGYGGLITTWEDWRDGGFLAQRYEVYAQHVNPDGSLGGPTAVDEVPKPQGLQILRTAPNPFGSSAEVTFDSEVAGDVEIRLYEVTGRLVLRDWTWAAKGENRYNLRAITDGHELASGVYFLHLHSRIATTSSKLVLTR